MGLLSRIVSRLHNQREEVETPVVPEPQEHGIYRTYLGKTARGNYVHKIPNGRVQFTPRFYNLDGTLIHHAYVDPAPAKISLKSANAHIHADKAPVSILIARA